MKIELLDYYANFVFMSEDRRFCVSTTDINFIRDSIKFESTKERIDSIHIGDFLLFSNTSNVYKVTDVQIEMIASDTNRFDVGTDTYNCIERQGIEKKPLFKIIVILKEK